MLEKPMGAREVTDLNSGDPSLQRRPHVSSEAWLAATENSTRTDFNNQGDVSGPEGTGESKVDVDSAAPAIWPDWSPPKCPPVPTNVLPCPPQSTPTLGIKWQSEHLVAVCFRFKVGRKESSPPESANQGPGVESRGLDGAVDPSREQCPWSGRTCQLPGWLVPKEGHI